MFRRRKGLQRQTHADGGLKLLKSLCTEEDMKDFDSHEGVWVKGPQSGNWYFVDARHIGVYTREREFGSYRGSRCMVVVDRLGRLSSSVTEIDKIIARMLLIRCNETYFRRQAGGSPR